MGKLPGLDKLKKDRSDLLIEEAAPVHAVAAPLSPAPAQPRPELVKTQDEQAKMQKDKKAEKKKDKEANEIAAKEVVIAARVSAEFKAEVAVYCVEQEIKEVKLIEEVLREALETNAEALIGGKRYDTTAGGTDVSKSIYGRYSDKAFKKAVVIMAKRNSISEGFIVSQAVARRIGWKKTL